MIFFDLKLRLGKKLGKRLGLNPTNKSISSSSMFFGNPDVEGKSTKVPSTKTTTALAQLNGTIIPSGLRIIKPEGSLSQFMIGF